ncbi:MAG: hypothetical protein K8W52_00730 [Deltaproteobacteria bacterium]|nr:hypothetical protein [Deltaproteobacteria bacterium]
MRKLLLPLIVIGLGLAHGRAAHAYPQYQLTKGQTCASCHVSPAGGGLLTGNGQVVAEDDPTFGGDGSFLSGKWTPPDWLQLGADARLATGITDPGHGISPAFFPMQADLYARAQHKGLSLNLAGGFRALGDNPAGIFQLHEHYVMWRKDDDKDGFYVRAGHFRPVIGLRLAEHAEAVRQYVNPLYNESYGLGVGWLSGKAEVHATAFVHDPIFGSAEDGDGAAFYGELRAGSKAAIGATGKYAKSSDDTRTLGGLTGKLWLEGAKLLFQGEVDLTHQKFDVGPSRNQLAFDVMTSYFLKPAWRVDLITGAFQEDLHLAKSDRESVSVNVSWSATAHIEVGFLSRVQTIGFGDGGQTSSWALLMGHYRM